METTFTVLLVLAMVVATAFALLIFFTSKGDAMSGGSNVRTTFKGKAGFDDFISKMVIYLGVGFMALMVIVDMIGARLPKDAPLPTIDQKNSAPSNGSAQPDAGSTTPQPKSK